MRLIWAFGDEPATFEKELPVFKYHQMNRGTKSVYLLNNQEFKAPDSPRVKHLDLVARNVS